MKHLFHPAAEPELLETLIILAIAHNSRHPDYWKQRIS